MADQHYFSTNPSGNFEPRLVEFEIAGRSFKLNSAAGTFSASKLDPGTRVLLSEYDHFPQQGSVLDLGCGWGAIGITIATMQPQTQVYGLDINTRSIDLANLNAKNLSLKNFRALNASGIPADMNFDAIWSNPPIRIGKIQLHELLSTWLPRLKPGGIAMLVVQKQLGADSLQKWLAENFSDFSVEKHSTDKGFRIIRLTRFP